MIYNWSLIIVSCVILIVLGLLASKKSETEEGFLIADRKLGYFTFTFTLMATWYSGWAFLGTPGTAYQYGYIEVLIDTLYLPAAVLVFMFFAGLIRKRSQELGSLSIPEFLGQIHGNSRPVHCVYAVINIVFMLVFLISQIKAMAYLMSPLMGVSITVATLIMGGVVIFYTTSGGLTAVAWTDVVQGIGMTIAAIAVVLVVLFQVGGLSPLTEAMAKIDPQLVNPAGSVPYGTYKWSAFLTFPFAFIGLICSPFLGVRFIAAKSDLKWHKVLLFMIIPLMIVWSAVSIVGPLMRTSSLAPLAKPDMAMPMFLQNYIHPYLYPIFAIFILFAMQSTADSILHNIAGSLSYDMRKVLFPNAKLSDRTRVLLNRMSVILFGVVGIIFTIWSAPAFLIYLGMLGLGTIRSAIAGPMLIGLFWKGTASGALVAALGGAAMCAWGLLTKNLGWTEAPMAGTVVGITLYVVVSALTRKRETAMRKL